MYPTPQKGKYKVYVRSITYNQAQYIEECLNGVAIQMTDFPFVHHVIDDCSTDGEQNVIKAWIQKNCDLNTVDYYDNGLCTITIAKAKNNPNYNLAAYFLKKNLYRDRSAKEKLYAPWREVCPYEAICEGDDYWTDPMKLQLQVDALDASPNSTLCHTSFKYYYQNEGIFIDSHDKIVNPTIKCTPQTLFEGYHVQTCSILYRTSLYLQAKEKDPTLFDGSFMFGDTPLYFALARMGEFIYIPKVTVVYRKNDGSATRQSLKKLYRFELSGAEFHWYLCSKYSFTPDFVESRRKMMIKALRKYWAFDPTFTSKFEIDYKKNILDKLLLATGLLKLYLIIKQKLRRIIGPIYRILIKIY